LLYTTTSPIPLRADSISWSPIGLGLFQSWGRDGISQTLGDRLNFALSRPVLRWLNLSGFILQIAAMAVAVLIYILTKIEIGNGFFYRLNAVWMYTSFPSFCLPIDTSLLYQ